VEVFVDREVIKLVEVPVEIIVEKESEPVQILEAIEEE
jgi:hypothetical protein